MHHKNSESSSLTGYSSHIYDTQQTSQVESTEQKRPPVTYHSPRAPKPQEQMLTGRWQTAVTSKSKQEAAVRHVLTSHHHHGHREDLLPISGGGNVAKADGGQAGHGEVQGGDVQRVFAGAALPLARATGIVAVRRSNADSQLVEPAVHLDGVGGLINDLVVSNAVPVKLAEGDQTDTSD